MPVAARSKLCCGVSDCAGAFVRSAVSSALSAWVIVLAGYLLLLSFISLKPLINNNKKERHPSDFSVPTDDGEKMKENENIEKYRRDTERT